jgi:hypothetical protein
MKASFRSSFLVRHILPVTGLNRSSPCRLHRETLMMRSLKMMMV